LDNTNQENGKVIPRIYKLDNSGYNGVLKDPDQYYEIASRVIEKSNEWGDKIPIGIFYQNENVASYDERIAMKIDNYIKYPPASQEIILDKNKTNSNINELLKSLKVNA
jgi:2-oxoglutarate ferredoxin oxidoreductase subunit beta